MAFTDAIIQSDLQLSIFKKYIQQSSWWLRTLLKSPAVVASQCWDLNSFRSEIYCLNHWATTSWFLFPKQVVMWSFKGFFFSLQYYWLLYATTHVCIQLTVLVRVQARRSMWPTKALCVKGQLKTPCDFLYVVWRETDDAYSLNPFLFYHGNLPNFLTVPGEHIL